MHKQWHPVKNLGWDDLSIFNLQRLHRWSLGMEWISHFIHTLLDTWSLIPFGTKINRGKWKDPLCLSEGEANFLSLHNYSYSLKNTRWLTSCMNISQKGMGYILSIYIYIYIIPCFVDACRMWQRLNWWIFKKRRQCHVFKRYLSPIKDQIHYYVICHFKSNLNVEL